MLHCDVGPRNILYKNGQFTLIDWEFAGIEDPRRELARTAAWYGFDHKETKTLLESYYGRNPTEEELQTTDILRTMIHLELCWLTFSFIDTESLSQKQWDTLYESTPPQALHEFAIVHDEIETHAEFPPLESLVTGFLKYFIQYAKG